MIFLCLDMIKHTYIDLLVVVSVTLSCARACAHAVFFAPVVWLFLVNRTCCPLRLCSLLGLSERAHAHTWCFSHMASVGRSSFIFAVVCSCIISSCCERARMRIRGVFYTCRAAASILVCGASPGPLLGFSWAYPESSWAPQGLSWASPGSLLGFVWVLVTCPNYKRGWFVSQITAPTSLRARGVGFVLQNTAPNASP